MAIDKLIFQAIHGLAGKSAWLDFLGVFFAQYLAYFIIIGFLITLAFISDWKKRFHHFAFVILSALIARGLIVETVRIFYYRPRPALVLDLNTLIATPPISSFPSGHAAVFFALGIAAYYLNKRWGIFLISAAVILSIGRVFVGVHWPFDILAGILVGWLSALIVRKILPNELRS